MSKPSVAELIQGVTERDRRALGRAITLVESSRVADQQCAAELVGELLPRTGSAMRVGISGVPGVGKSTFIESLGMTLVESGRRVAVLAVDPSSARTGGSILGDKTRMQRLAGHPAAFIRPSPAAGTLGGVARRTREAMVVCEAAGFDVMIVESVGVGQSEYTLASMVDVFLLLMLAGAGDELQGIKRGIMELADVLCINKADGSNVPAAERAAAEYRSALRLLHGARGDGEVPVLTASALHKHGLDEVWTRVTERFTQLKASGGLESRRREQRRQWFSDALGEALRAKFLADPRVASRLPSVEAAVVDNRKTVGQAITELLENAWS